MKSKRCERKRRLQQQKSAGRRAVARNTRKIRCRCSRLSSWLYTQVQDLLTVSLSFTEAFTAVAEGRETRWEGTVSGGGGSVWQAGGGGGEERRVEGGGGAAVLYIRELLGLSIYLFICIPASSTSLCTCSPNWLYDCTTRSGQSSLRLLNLNISKFYMEFIFAIMP